MLCTGLLKRAEPRHETILVEMSLMQTGHHKLGAMCLAGAAGPAHAGGESAASHHPAEAPHGGGPELGGCQGALS